jgi:MFS family permease
LARPAAYSRRGVLAGCLLGLASGWNLGNVGAMASEMARVYGVSLAVVGLFTTALIVTHTAVQIPGGRASDRFGPARAGLAALVLIAAGSAIALTVAEPAVALLARAVTGLGTGLAFIAGSALVQRSGGSPFAQGLFGGIGLGSGGLALALVPRAAESFGWRAAFWTSLALAVVVLVIVLRISPSPGPVAGGGRPAHKAPALLADGRLRRLALLYAASYGLSVVLGNWTIEMLLRHGSMTDAAAGFIGSLTLLLVVVTRPVGGWILRAHPHETRLAVGASLLAGAGGTLALIAAEPVWLAALGAALVGIGAGISFSPAFTAAAVTRPDAPAAAVGVVNAAANTVVLLGTPLVGLSFAMPGDGRIGFAAVAVLWLAALAFLPSGSVLSPAASEARHR